MDVCSSSLCRFLSVAFEEKKCDCSKVQQCHGYKDEQCRYPLRVSEFAGFQDFPQEQTFTLLAGTQSLYIQLWGAGGGGAGGPTSIYAFGTLVPIAVAGGGGGAGGYAEARIENPNPSYSFLLARGGLGSKLGNGEGAGISYFSSESEIFAYGGEGGKWELPQGTEIGFGTGGKGGISGGTKASASSTGGAGETALLSRGDGILITAGGGGINAVGATTFTFSVILHYFFF